MRPWLKIPVLFLLFSFPLMGVTREKYPTFYPHMSATARTAGSGNVVFEVFPGANGMSSVFLNSLGIGIGNRFQVGTIPLLYLVGNHQHNYNLKWNFLLNKYIQMAVGYARMAFETGGNGALYIEEEGRFVQVDEIYINYFSLFLNWFPESLPFELGVNISTVDLSAESKTATNQLQKEKKPTEILIDAAFRIGKNFVITPGIGWQRTNRFDISSRSLPFGFGSSFSLVREKANWFRRVTLGYHFVPSESHSLFLLSFSL